MKTIQMICSKRGEAPFRQTQVAFQPDLSGQEMQLVLVYPDVQRQTIQGFGGAFTQAAAQNYAAMTVQTQEKFLAACFSAEGLGYTLGRMPVGSCDFSETGSVSYCDKENDTELASFSVEQDEAELLPLIYAAQTATDSTLRLMASPWSPPAWMKDTGEMLRGGKLLPEFYACYAAYLVKFLLAYREKGVPIAWLTVQNEPMAVQSWESCIYTAEDELAFLQDALLSALAAEELNTGVFVWDHNKEQVFLRARKLFADETVRQQIAGLAFHWYSGDHFENLRLFCEAYPEKELFFTEGCVELTNSTTMSQKLAQKEGVEDTLNGAWSLGEIYAHDMIGNFNHGMTAFFDWNLLLDERGGPNHQGNYCSAPLLYDRSRDMLVPQSSYYFIAHFSRYVLPGSVLIAHSSYTGELKLSSFLRPDGQVCIVVLNETMREIPFTLKDTEGEGIAALCAAAQSITTYLY